MKELEKHLKQRNDYLTKLNNLLLTAALYSEEESNLAKTLCYKVYSSSIQADKLFAELLGAPDADIGELVDLRNKYKV